MWESWKQNFFAWEKATTQFVEKALANPGVIGPAGAMLSTVMKTKAATDKAIGMWWNACGLPTRDQSQLTLHKLNQLESRLFDLEEQLAANRK